MSAQAMATLLARTRVPGDVSRGCRYLAIARGLGIRTTELAEADEQFRLLAVAAGWGPTEELPNIARPAETRAETDY